MISNGEDFDLVMKAIADSKKPNDYDEIKNVLQVLQDKVEKLEKENRELKSANEEPPKENPVDPLEKYRDEWTKLENEVAALMSKICEETEFKMMAMCISKISKTRLSQRFGGTDVSLSYSKSFDDMSEEGMAAAAEVFTNPRRIAILKILAFDDLTASEIALKAGLVGGQLYHHLASLENAGLISKENDKFKAGRGTYGLLISLYAVFGRMKIATITGYSETKEMKASQ